MSGFFSLILNFLACFQKIIMKDIELMKLR